MARLVRRLMAADLNLYAAHLALDAHQEVGNNAELARRLGLEVIGWWERFTVRRWLCRRRRRTAWTWMT